MADGMVKRTGTGTVEEYQGKKLNPALTYSYEWDEPVNVQAAKDAGLWLGDDSIFKVVKQNQERSAKSSAYQAAIKPLKEAYESSPEFKRSQFIKAAIEMGMSQAQAEAIANSNGNL